MTILEYDDDTAQRNGQRQSDEPTTGGIAEMMGVDPTGGMGLETRRQTRRQQYINENIILLVTSGDKNLQSTIRDVFESI